jgi:sulfur dioxygenase
VEEFAEIMDNLKLPNPKMMDVAIPSNAALGSDINDNIKDEQIIDTKEAIALVGDENVLFIDLREEYERSREGIIPNSMLLPFQDLDDACENEDHAFQKALKENKKVIFYCANGERSALTLEILADQGINGCIHLRKGTTDWLKQNGPIEEPKAEDGGSPLSFIKKLFS